MSARFMFTSSLPCIRDVYIHIYDAGYETPAAAWRTKPSSVKAMTFADLSPSMFVFHALCWVYVM